MFSDGCFSLDDIEEILKSPKNRFRQLDGDGSFSSPECLAYLQECDIVVTNPPFSLFREFVSLLFSYKKDFLIIGNKLSLGYKDVFEAIQKNKARTGYRKINQDMYFIVPEGEKYEKIMDGEKVKHISATWITTLPVSTHNEFMDFFREYSPEEYPDTYDNFPAIEVNKVKDIPGNYFDYIGVPLTYLDKFNPEQFELVRFRKGNDGKDLRIKRTGRQTFTRLIIRRKR